MNRCAVANKMEYAVSLMHRIAVANNRILFDRIRWPIYEAVYNLTIHSRRDTVRCVDVRIELNQGRRKNR